MEVIWHDWLKEPPTEEWQKVLVCYVSLNAYNIPNPSIDFEKYISYLEEHRDRILSVSYGAGTVLLHKDKTPFISIMDSSFLFPIKWAEYPKLEEDIKVPKNIREYLE